MGYKWRYIPAKITFNINDKKTNGWLVKKNVILTLIGAFAIRVSIVFFLHFTSIKSIQSTPFTAAGNGSRNKLRVDESERGGSRNGRSEMKEM